MRPDLHESPPSRTRLQLVSVQTSSGVRTDRDLVLAARKGERSAGAALWDRHVSLIRAILRRMLSSRADAEDAVQEVFLRFFRELERLQNPDAARSYLVGIAVRVARTEQRRRRLRRWLPWQEADERFVSSPPAALDVAREPLAHLEGILNDVAYEDRVLFVCRCVEGLELAEIAGALGISLSTVKRKLKRVLARIELRASRDPVLAGYIDASAWKEEF